MTQDIRNGKGHRAYRRQQAALKRRTQRLNLPCVWCGQPFDFALHYNDKMAFTADHPQALANGGKLLGQQLQPMHKGCNSRRGDYEETDLDMWAAS